MTLDEYRALPLAEVVVSDPSPFPVAGAKPLVHIEVDGKPVAQLPVTGARLEVGIGMLSHLHLTLIAGDANLRSRPKIHPSPQLSSSDG